MKVEQIYTGCLSEAAYYIESDGEAAVIDPLRDVHPYIIKASKNKATIKYIFETHFHADFVSGHKELADKTGATIVFGPTAAPGYKAHVAYDGEQFKIGNVTIVTMHTPGHSLESTTWLLKDEDGNDFAIFTGDTLFINSVGRPDLIQKVKSEITPRFLAGLLFDSLRNKIMPLPDNVIVYPGHGSGSPCGKDMAETTVDTLGGQKKTNPALNKKLTREAFIEQSLKDLIEPPAYFPFNIISNLGGDIPQLDDVLSQGIVPLSPSQFKQRWLSEKAMVIDTRDIRNFVEQFIPGSLPVSFNQSFITWIDKLLPDMRQPLLLITEKDKSKEVIIQLSRIGYHNVIGCLKGGLKAWSKEGFETASVKEINEIDYLATLKKDKSTILLDVSNQELYMQHHLKGSVHVELGYLIKTCKNLDIRKKYFVIGADSYSSVIGYAVAVQSGLNCQAVVKRSSPIPQLIRKFSHQK